MRWLVFLSLLFLLLSGLVRAAPTPVGTITLVLGEAWVIADDGQRHPAVKSATIQSGQTIETAASGHLHVRFLDGGVIAVRPASRLVIEDYRDPRTGGAIRFRLERGAVRSITGAWGETDHSRFRLNTPIAAIGISGTDFVVQGNDDLVRAVVYQGGIIVAPFDAACRPEDLGPCGGERARSLTAEMGLMLELKRGNPTPILVPKNGLAAREEARRVAESAALPKSETLTQAAAGQTLPAPAPVPAPLPATLVWGHWAHVPAWPDDATLPREAAAAGRERVAENSRYVLYRLPQTEPLPVTGVAQFTLAGAQAHLVRTDGVLPAQVLDGRLTLDFAGRRFDTALSLSAQPIGSVPFVASGTIRPDGTFSLIEWQNRLHGAYGVGGSGPTAAYLFERATPQGMFMGITQWR